MRNHLATILTEDVTYDVLREVALRFERMNAKWDARNLFQSDSMLDTIACVSLVFYATAKTLLSETCATNVFTGFHFPGFMRTFVASQVLLKPGEWSFQNKGPETVSSLDCWSPISGPNIVKV